ncbi:MAG: hypothetical protein KDJ22_17010 [Candidatus Competibacteraceae bacterium]|nr:hypothetical protein [Candidatus Competibacteraceae bacterium]HRX70094.1 hypothetical protein [Candidatus Competibacteraceae bacterium]
MNTVRGRNFARQPGDIVMILLLALLLAFRAHACLLPTGADPAGPAIHDCCPDEVANVLVNSASSPCHDDPCLQAPGEYNGLQTYLPSANEPDQPAPIRVVEWLPPDGARRHSVPHPFIPAVGPPPLQRSRVLRL